MPLCQCSLLWVTLGARQCGWPERRIRLSLQPAPSTCGPARVCGPWPLHRPSPLPPSPPTSPALTPALHTCPRMCTRLPTQPVPPLPSPPPRMSATQLRPTTQHPHTPHTAACLSCPTPPHPLPPHVGPHCIPTHSRPHLLPPIHVQTRTHAHTALGPPHGHQLPLHYEYNLLCQPTESPTPHTPPEPPPPHPRRPACGPPPHICAHPPTHKHATAPHTCPPSPSLQTPNSQGPSHSWERTLCTRPSPLLPDPSHTPAPHPALCCPGAGTLTHICLAGPSHTSTHPPSHPPPCPPLTPTCLLLPPRRPAATTTPHAAPHTALSHCILHPPPSGWHPRLGGHRAGAVRAPSWLQTASSLGPAGAREGEAGRCDTRARIPPQAPPARPHLLPGPGPDPTTLGLGLQHTNLGGYIQPITPLAPPTPCQGELLAHVAEGGTGVWAQRPLVVCGIADSTGCFSPPGLWEHPAGGGADRAPPPPWNRGQPGASIPRARQQLGDPALGGHALNLTEGSDPILSSVDQGVPGGTGSGLGLPVLGQNCTWAGSLQRTWGRGGGRAPSEVRTRLKDLRVSPFEEPPFD